MAGLSKTVSRWKVQRVMCSITILERQRLAAIQ